jgi:hypothetical protein
LVAERLGDTLDLDRIWQAQDISTRLKKQIETWAIEVNDVLHRSAGGKMVSEWAKKAECWDAIRNSIYSERIPDIPEIN